MTSIAESLLSQLPEALRAEVSSVWQQIAGQNSGLVDEARKDPVLAALPRALACSNYLREQLQRRPSLLRDLMDSGDLVRDYDAGTIAGRLQQLMPTLTDEAGLRAAVRGCRHREMVRIAWRDIGGLVDLETTMRETSWLADALVDAALDWLTAQQCATVGTPTDAAGQPQRLFVVAMGKLGGLELNFSSDIDLLFGYPRGGETSGGTRSQSNQEFFDRLGRKLISVLNEQDADGFVFRVDMRLRPFGDSGALTQSIASMESYYAAHARDWERYAMIKARICAGDRAAGKAFLSSMQPFVYRRYIDFGALQSLREMKALIAAEVVRSELHDDVKRGPGGIREIEFIAQMFQLVRGGREPALRVRPTCTVLRALQSMGELPSAAVDELIAAYVFLRNTEHRIQQIDDRQTQALPQTDIDQLRLAIGLGFPDWTAFSAALASHRANVQAHFGRLLDSPARSGTRPDTTHADGLAELWAGTLDREQALAVLAAVGIIAPPAVLDEIDKLRAAPAIGRLSRHGQERMQRLMPQVLVTVAGRPGEMVALRRIFDLLESVARRSVYLSLLAEQPQALQHLARLVAASPWIARCIVQQPILLDELLDPRSLYAPPQADALDRSLRSEIAKHPVADVEQQMEALRHFRQAEVLRVAASDLTGHLPLPEVSNHLSWIAESTLRGALDIAWEHLRARHGTPRCRVDGETGAAGFAIVAYGKLGGLELGYGSDLDLVFLHDSRGEEQETDGSKGLDNATFFTRLAQRVIHLISTLTPAGVAYEIDTRLRPSGASGLLVSSLEAFDRYQREQAWTWEHQALVRARPVAGDAAVSEQFAAIRGRALSRPRPRPDLRREIVEMRAKMRTEHARTGAGVFNLKQDAGGITDIEFMVQYEVLAFAADHPAVLAWTDNKRLLEVFSDSGILPAAHCQQLRDAYFEMRHRIHRCALQELPPEVPDTEFQDQRRVVIELWNELLLNDR